MSTFWGDMALNKYAFLDYSTTKSESQIKCLAFKYSLHAPMFHTGNSPMLFCHWVEIYICTDFPFTCVQIITFHLWPSEAIWGWKMVIWGISVIFSKCVRPNWWLIEIVLFKNYFGYFRPSGAIWGWQMVIQGISVIFIKPRPQEVGLGPPWVLHLFLVCAWYTVGQFSWTRVTISPPLIAPAPSIAPPPNHRA